ncbi:MAG: Elongation factor Tu [Promethearchaeota archaeon]|nr:MAG: Elongation factor Tu [Candidatus Lokiarchaeota archaeon]
MKKTEESFNVGIIGENPELNNILGQAFGAPGTRSDLQFYNRLDQTLGYIFFAITPIDYPDKIKPLLQTLAMTDIYILVIDLEIGLNSVIGELLMAMDHFCRLYQRDSLIIIANITSKNEWKLAQTIKRLRKILETTYFPHLKIIPINNKGVIGNLKKEVVNIGLDLFNRKINIEDHSLLKILIDHAFPVKGVGTVALGIVKEGILKKGQMVEIVGYNSVMKKTIVRSIQKQDRNFPEAYRNERVGLVLKGIKPNEIDRNNLLAIPGTFKEENEILVEFTMNEFYKPKGGKISSDNRTQFFAIEDTRLTSMRFVDGTDLYPGISTKSKIVFDKPLYHNGSGLKGIITERNKFEKKLRIIGYFKQIV